MASDETKASGESSGPGGAITPPDYGDLSPEDQAALRLRNRIRRTVGVILLAALLTCIVLGIYRVLQATGYVSSE